MYKRPQELESQALEELGISKDEYDAYPDAVKAIVANHLVNGPPRKRLNVGQFAEMEITTDEAVIAKLEEMGEGLPKETKRVKTLSECFTGPDGQRLFLRLMRAESLSLAMLDKIEPLALRSSSSRLEYKTIAPLFGLNPTLRGRDMGTIDIQYARLPSKVWLEVLQSVDMAEQMLGEFDLHENEQARSQWIDAWFRPIIALFESRVRKVPHSSSGRMESQFFMDTIRMLRLIVTNHSLTDNKEFVNQMAQIMGELNVSAYRNGKNSMEINPINGILTDGEKYFVFEYNHETRTFKKSYPLRVNTDNSATIARSMEEVPGD
ncbi:hypothetical protein HK104_002711 [Borealophlyctis nickersoniae]|nr:hypothetical protein HK104_002711 [Borealophlyctis nickersoniae]